MALRKRAIDDKTRAKDVSGNVYIVTGANSGVGLETTRQLLAQGHRHHRVTAYNTPTSQTNLFGGARK